MGAPCKAEVTTLITDLSNKVKDTIIKTEQTHHQTIINFEQGIKDKILLSNTLTREKEDPGIKDKILLSSTLTREKEDPQSMQNTEPRKYRRRRGRWGTRAKNGLRCVCIDSKH